MSDDKDKTKTNQEGLTPDFLEGLYGDPFAVETAKIGRYLVIASIVCIAVVLFKVRLQSTSLIPLDVGDRSDVLPMLLSLAVLLLALSFLLRSSTDLFRDREATVLVLRYIEAERVGAALSAAQEAEADIVESQRDNDEHWDDGPDPWWEPYYNIKAISDAAVQKAEKRIGIRRVPRIFRSVRKGLELLVPLIFAMTALFLSRSSLSSFVVALKDSLW